MANQSECTSVLVECWQWCQLDMVGMKPRAMANPPTGLWVIVRYYMRIDRSRSIQLTLGLGWPGGTVTKIWLVVLVGIKKSKHLHFRKLDLAVLLDLLCGVADMQLFWGGENLILDVDNRYYFNIYWQGCKSRLVTSDVGSRDSGLTDWVRMRTDRKQSVLCPDTTYLYPGRYIHSSKPQGLRRKSLRTYPFEHCLAPSFHISFPPQEIRRD